MGHRGQHRPTALKKRLVADIETNGLLDKLTKLHSITIEDLDTGETWSCAHDPRYTSIEEGLAILSEADEIIGHNWIAFDDPAIRKVYPHWECKATLIDTMICTRTMWPDLWDRDTKLFEAGKLEAGLRKRHSLKAWGQRLGIMKDDFKSTDNWQTWSVEMQDYAEQDVTVTTALYRLILSKGDGWTDGLKLEHSFFKILEAQQKQGTPFNMAAAPALLETLVTRHGELEAELVNTFGSWEVKSFTISKRTFHRAIPGTWVTEARYSDKTGKRLKDYEGPERELIKEGDKMWKSKTITFNPGSRDHIAKVLKERFKWKPKKFTKTGKPEVSEETLSGLEHIPEAALVIEYLMVTKRISALSSGKEAWMRLAKLGDDGVYRIHGKINHMGAATSRVTHSRPNISQVPSLHNPKGPVPYGRDCRELFITTPGLKLVGADASGLELRCLAHYLGRFDGGYYTDLLLNGDPHTAMQLAAGLDSRDQAKTFTYALLYGAGDRKLGRIIDPTASPKLQTEIGSDARAGAEEKIPGFGRLTKGVKSKAKKTGTIKGLDGRIIPVRHAHAALNTLLQSCGAIVMKRATVIKPSLCTEYPWTQLMFNHDEWQDEVLPEDAERHGQNCVEAIKLAGEYYNMRCPLDGEYNIGDNWAATH